MSPNQSKLGTKMSIWAPQMPRWAHLGALWGPGALILTLQGAKWVPKGDPKWPQKRPFLGAIFEEELR